MWGSLIKTWMALQHYTPLDTHVWGWGNGATRSSLTPCGDLYSAKLWTSWHPVATWAQAHSLKSALRHRCIGTKSVLRSRNWEFWLCLLNMSFQQSDWNYRGGQIWSDAEGKRGRIQTMLAIDSQFSEEKIFCVDKFGRIYAKMLTVIIS